VSGPRHHEMGPGGAYESSPHTAGAHEDIGQVPLGQLVGDVSRDLSMLMRQELALAQAELKQEASKTAKSAGLFGGAAFAGYTTLLFLSIAVWWALSHLVGHSWSALIVAVFWGVTAAVLGAGGRSNLRRIHSKPEQTVDTLKRVPEALKGQTGGTR